MGFVRWHVDHERTHMGETAWFGEMQGRVLARCAVNHSVGVGFYGRYRGTILGAKYVTDSLHDFKREAQQRADDHLDDTLHNVAGGDLPPGDAVKCGNRADLTKRERVHRWQELGLDERRGNAAGQVVAGIVSACRRCGYDRFERVA